MTTTNLDLINPYWDAVSADVVTEARGWDKGPFIGSIDNWEPTRHRHDRTSQYAWTVTSPETVAFVVEHIGRYAVDPLAGSGYWAYLLGQAGVNVFAADIAPGDNQWHKDGTWTDVRQMDAVEAVRHAAVERTLLLSWPPYGDPIGHEILRAYTGNRVIYIGETEGGCCGDDAMFALLSSGWTEVAEHRPVQWYGMHDWITVYERKAVTA